MPPLPDAFHFWPTVTRLGEAQWLLPLAAVCVGWMVWQGASKAALQWLAAFGLAIGTTLATKLAFIGWGLGLRVADFTGVSGHTMLAAAVYPLALRLLMTQRPMPAQHLAWLAGHALAWLVAWSRVEVQAHSWSEVLAGMAVGSAAGLLAWRPVRSRGAALPKAVPGLFAIGLLLTAPAQAGTPTINSHQLVTRMALELSGRAEPYTRREMRREMRQGRAPESRQP